MRQDTPVSRRQLLAGLGTAGAAGLAGCSFVDEEERTPTPGPVTTTRRTTEARETAEVAETTEPTPPESLPYADEYGTLVDLVEAGADPEGEEPLGPVLESAVGADTLAYLPPGRYRMASPWQLPSFRNVALVGGPATIVPDDGYVGYLFLLGWDGGGHNARVENLTFDFRAANTGARPLQILADDLAVRDVSVVGRQETGRGMMRFDVTDPEGTGLVERMYLPDGAAVQTGTVGCLVGPACTGKITFRDCRIEGFPNNGLYASPAKGPVLVEGGYYANNGIASVRVSGDSVVRGVHVRCDDASRPLDNMRGIRVRHGKSALVEDCTVELVEATYCDGAITIEPLVESATVRDTAVRVDVDKVPAVRVKSPAPAATRDRNAADDPRIRVGGVHISGSAADQSAVQVVDRDDCRFDGLCVRQSGAHRNGFHLVRSQGNVLRDALIDVTGDPFVLENSPLEKIDVVVAPKEGRTPVAASKRCYTGRRK